MDFFHFSASVSVYLMSPRRKIYVFVSSSFFFPLMRIRLNKQKNASRRLPNAAFCATIKRSLKRQRSVILLDRQAARRSCRLRPFRKARSRIHRRAAAGARFLVPRSAERIAAPVVRHRLGYAGAPVQPDGRNEGRAAARAVCVLRQRPSAAHEKHAADDVGPRLPSLFLQHGDYQRRGADHLCAVRHNGSAHGGAGKAADPRRCAANACGQPRQHAHAVGEPAEPLPVPAVRPSLFRFSDSDASLRPAVRRRAGAAARIPPPGASPLYARGGPPGQYARAALLRAGVCALYARAAELLPAPAVAAVVLLFLLFADRGLLRSLDYSLLCTFLAFFVFIGNMERIEPFRLWLRSTLAGNDCRRPS